MAFGWGGAALSPAIWVAVPFVIGGAAGNGAAIICNQILVQRGAPDRFRGRALSTIMSTNYLILGLAMGAAGLSPTGWARAAVMLSAAAIYVVGAVAALLVTRWLPVKSAGDDHLLEAYGEAAAGALIPLDGVRREPQVVGAAPAQPPPRGGLGRGRARADRRPARGDRGASGERGRSRAPIGHADDRPHRVRVVARREWALDELTSGVRAGDRRALARAISLVENGDPLAYPLVRELYPETGRPS